MLTQPTMMHANMANTGYIKLDTKDLVTVIHEETADKVDQSQLNAKINLSGSRGLLAGYEQQTNFVATSVNIGYLSSDANTCNAENNASVTVNLDGGNIPSIAEGHAVKILRIYNTMSTTSITFNKINGIATIDFFGEDAPTLSGKGTIYIVADFNGPNVSLRITQY